ncbi:nitroreductase [Phaeovulum sp.]|uniref:nitroreductase family protein n=1 Tax=Phaeovulum sp. TaxID=2934796 RepID=UPI0039E5409D
MSAPKPVNPDTAAVNPALPNPAVLEFLLTRRSRPARTLALPVPDRAKLTQILTAAARTPDHGKLEPWRFIVLTRPALERLGTLARTRGAEGGLRDEKLAKAVSQYSDSHLAVAVVNVPRPTDKIPHFEQLLSTGAVCLSLLNATLAAGFGANWLTGWLSQDPQFCAEGLGLLPGERVAGLIHIGTETITPPERPRPDLEAITTWIDA